MNFNFGHGLQFIETGRRNNKMSPQKKVKSSLKKSKIKIARPLIVEVLFFKYNFLTSIHALLQSLVKIWLKQFSCIHYSPTNRVVSDCHVYIYVYITNDYKIELIILYELNVGKKTTKTKQLERMNIKQKQPSILSEKVFISDSQVQMYIFIKIK